MAEFNGFHVDLESVAAWINQTLDWRLVKLHEHWDSTFLMEQIQRWTQAFLELGTASVLTSIDAARAGARVMMTTLSALYDDHSLASLTHRTWPLVLLLLVILLLIIVVFLLGRSGQGSKLRSKAIHLSIVSDAYNLAKTAYEPGHCEQLISLIENHDLDINKFYCAGEPSLFLCACLSGERKIINYMLKQGASVSGRTQEGDSCVYLATYGTLNSADPDTALLEDLVHAGGDVNAQNHRGYTPLHRAASKGDEKVIATLLDLGEMPVCDFDPSRCQTNISGADPYITNNTGIYPLDSAINAGHIEAARLLRINLRNPYQVWDIVEPHTPSVIRMGLQSPYKKHLMESTVPSSHRSKKQFFEQTEP